jgi:hypothetical protein
MLTDSHTYKFLELGVLNLQNVYYNVTVLP